MCVRIMVSVISLCIYVHTYVPACEFLISKVMGCIETAVEPTSNEKNPGTSYSRISC